MCVFYYDYSSVILFQLYAIYFTLFTFAICKMFYRKRTQGSIKGHDGSST